MQQFLKELFIITGSKTQLKDKKQCGAGAAAIVAGQMAQTESPGAGLFISDKMLERVKGKLCLFVINYLTTVYFYTLYIIPGHGKTEGVLRTP